VMGQHEISPVRRSSVRTKTCYSEGQISVIGVKLMLPEHIADPL